MKKLGLIGFTLITIGVLATVGILKAYNPQPVQQFVRVVKTPPVNHIGDSQNGVTLTHVYAPATPLTAMDEVEPGTILVAVQIPGISYEDLHQSLIYTSANEYLKPLGGNVKQCSDCAVFIVPRNVLVTSFIYKDSKWYL